jgi:CDGSH-type Zn-finger protein
VVAVWENGPYAVRGDVRVAGQTVTRCTLCRCGASANKPFCDGSHVAAGFKATGELAPPESLPDWDEAGPLTVAALADGPLKVDGAHEVTSGTGHAAKRAERAFLCRCGASMNKPFCDGTHRKVGFTAPGA